jgi:porin
MDIDHAQVIEAYYRFVVNDFLALSADIQYMQDDRTEEESPEGFIFCLRVTAEI